MSVVTSKSTVITNRDASPRTINNPGASGAAVRGFVGQIAAANGDSVNSLYIFGTIPSNAVIRSLGLYCQAMGTNATMSFGLYRTTADGAAAVNAAYFASAKDMSSAINGTDILHDTSGSNTIDNAEKRVFELLGLSTDPCINYDLVGKVTAAIAATAKIAIKCSYSI
jgi:hypothetical protein